jgi:hypothetical protein
MTQADGSLLDHRLEQTYSALGALDPDVLTRTRPALIDGEVVLWPANALGRQRIVRRPGSVLFATQGLAYPFDPSIHDDAPPALGFELGIELSAAEPFKLGQTVGNVSNAALAESWAVELLWAFADCCVVDRFKLLAQVARYGLATTIAPMVRGLESWTLPNGALGVLAGMPIVGDEPIGLEGQLLLGRADEVEPRLVMLKLLTPDEYEWATTVPDASVCIELAEMFRYRGDGHLSSAVRRSLVIVERRW